MIITITKVTQEFTKNGSEYRKVTGAKADGGETTKSVFDNLKEKWGLLKENKTLEFKLQKNGQFWNVVDITEPVVLPPQQPQVLPEHQEVIDKAVNPPETKIPHNPQEIGLAYKILADMYINGFIDENKPDGKELVIRLKMWLKEVLLNR